MSRLFTLAQLERHNARNRAYRRARRTEPRDPTIPATKFFHDHATRERARDHACALEILAAEEKRRDELRAIALERFPHYEDLPMDWRMP